MIVLNGRCKAKYAGHRTGCKKHVVCIVTLIIIATRIIRFLILIVAFCHSEISNNVARDFHAERKIHNIYTDLYKISY